jgi:hypothetical protein
MLQNDLVDVLHIFRGNKPASGSIVTLDTGVFGSTVKLVQFDGGVWEVRYKAESMWHNI